MAGGYVVLGVLGLVVNVCLVWLGVCALRSRRARERELWRMPPGGR